MEGNSISKKQQEDSSRFQFESPDREDIYNNQVNSNSQLKEKKLPGDDFSG